MNETIEFTIRSDSGNFNEKPLLVPPGLKTLHLDINMQEEHRYMGYVVIKDASGAARLQKLLGYGEQKLAVGCDGEHTTIGGVPGRIIPGIWKIGLYVFTEYMKQRLEGKEMQLQVLVTATEDEITEPMGSWCWVGEQGTDIRPEKYDWGKIYQKEQKWYKGDFHTHTTLSDGKETTVHAMEKARDMDMDFYVPTEHNLVHTGWCSRDICILPGIEVTTDKGHFNLFGISKMPEHLPEIMVNNGKPDVEPYIQAVIREALQEDWIISINHPFLTIWRWQYGNTSLKDFHCVEIINDPTYPDAPPSNDKAIRFVDALWEDGHKIYGVGGSDAHNLLEERYEGANAPSVAGDPGTYVFSSGLSPKSLMDNVRQGHICVTRFCRIDTKILADGIEYLPGDEIKVKMLKEKLLLTYGAKITGLKNTPEVFFIKNGQKLPAHVWADSRGDYNIKETVCVNDREWNWLRLEIRNKKGEFLGFVNPVYCGHKTSCCNTVKDIIDRMGEK